MGIQLEEGHFGHLTLRVGFWPKFPLKISSVEFWKCHEKLKLEWSRIREKLKGGLIINKS